MRKLKNHNISKATRLVCLLWLLPAIALQAQTVTLKLRNGDRISGKIISENTNQVMLGTGWAKEIAIPLAEIQSRETIAPVAVAKTNAPAVAKTNSPPAPVVAVAPPKPAEKPKTPTAWHGDIQVGNDVGLGKTQRQLYYGRFKIIYAPAQEAGPTGTSSAIGRFRNIFDYNGTYGKVDGIVSANQMYGSSKTDFDLGKDHRVFVYNLAGVGFDTIRKIDLRYEIGPGVGYHVLTRSNLVFNTEVGMNYQVQYLQDNSNTKQFYYRLAEDLTWKISKKLTFDEKFEFFPRVDFQDYRFRFESNLRYWFLDNFSFNLTVLDIYDTQTAPNVGRNDFQIRSSVGVKF